jgi:hypothetical protein
MWITFLAAQVQAGKGSGVAKSHRNCELKGLFFTFLPFIMGSEETSGFGWTDVFLQRRERISPQRHQRLTPLPPVPLDQPCMLEERSLSSGCHHFLQVCNT